MKRVSPYVHTMDTISEWLGKIAGYITLPLLFIMSFEVISRYIFNSPTLWSWDVEKQLQGLMLAIGGGYVLLQNGHIRVDVLVSRMTPRRRMILDLCLRPFFFFGMGVLWWMLAKGGWFSLSIQEHSSFGLFQPPVYPIKMIITIGVALFILQGVANFIRDISLILAPKETGKE